MKAGASSGTRNVPWTNDCGTDGPAPAVIGTPCVAASANGIAARKPAIITTSCTRLTHAELRSPPATKYASINTPPTTAPTQRGCPATTWSTEDTPISCAAKHEHRDAPQNQRRHQTHGRRIAELEIVAQRQESMRAGFPPQPRSDPPGENQRPETSGPVPPPRAPAKLITEACGTDRRSRANVGREHRCEHEQGRQSASRHEEGRHCRGPAGRPASPSATRPAE